MTDETGSSGAPSGAMPDSDAKPETQPQAEPPATGDESSPSEEPSLGEAGQRALADERKARREAERRAKTAEEQLAAARQAQLSEEERRAERLTALEAERAEWEKERRELRMSQAISDLAPRYGLIDPEAVLRLIDWSSVEFDERGRPLDVEDAVRELLQRKPYLATPGVPPQRAQSIGATEASSAGAAPRLTAQELEAAKEAGLTPERYAALKTVSTLDQWLATRRSS